jgi:integrase
LFAILPLHLRRMALFKVNTGCREKEVCRLQWDWEVQLPELNTSVFIIPAQMVKNRELRLVVLNKTAKEVIDEVRGIHEKYVFTYSGRPVTKLNNSAWKRARKKVGLEQVRVHDLKHTFGRRLRAAGVSFEDRQDLLGHRSGRITTHYSAAEVDKLIEAANKVYNGKTNLNGTALTILKCTGTIRSSSSVVCEKHNTIEKKDLLNQKHFGIEKIDLCKTKKDEFELRHAKVTQAC